MLVRQIVHRSSIEWVEDKWMLQDGDGAKPSTNGTW